MDQNPKCEEIICSYLYASKKPMNIYELCECQDLKYGYRREVIVDVLNLLIWNNIVTYNDSESFDRNNIYKKLDAYYMIKGSGGIYHKLSGLYSINHDRKFNIDFDWKKKVKVCNDKYDRKQRKLESKIIDDKSIVSSENEVSKEKKSEKTHKKREPQKISKEERLYNYIDSVGNIVSYEQIKEGMKSEYITDIEISEILQRLLNEKSIFRFTFKGVPFFSADKDVADNAIVINEEDNAINEAIDKILLGSNENLDISKNLIRYFKKKESKETGPYNLTYSNNTKLKVSDYVVSIPDNFKYEENVNDMDFIAWLPYEDDEYDFDVGYIRIYASGESSFPSNILIRDRKDLKIINDLITYEAILSLDTSFYELGLGTETVYEIFHDDKINAVLIALKFIGIWTFILNVTMVDRIKRFYITFNCDDMEYDQLKSIVYEWANKLELRGEPVPLKKCDSSGYFSAKLNKKISDEWFENYKERLSYIEQVKTWEQELLDKNYEKRNKKDVLPETAFKARYRSILTNSAAKYEELINEVTNAFVIFSKNNPESPFLLNMYKKISKILPPDRLSIKSKKGDIFVNIQEKDTIIEKIRTPEIASLIDKKIKDVIKKAEEEERANKLRQKKKLLWMESEYVKACKFLESAVTIKDYIEVKAMFYQLGDYKLSKDLGDYCYEKKYAIITKEALKNSAKYKFEVKWIKFKIAFLMGS